MAFVRFALLVSLLVLYNVISKGEVDEEYLFFHNCGAVGWSCLNETHGFLDLLYQCSNEAGWNVVIGKLDLNLPAETKSLTVQNCHEVEATLENFPNETLISLAIKNIVNLTLIPTTMNVSIPQRIVLENIFRINLLKSFTFTGNLESIVFHNVSINHIVSDAFFNLNVEESIKWDKVKIGLLDVNALYYIKVHKEFIISNTFIDTMEMHSFHVKAPRVVIENSHISDVRFNAIIVWADRFLLTNNSGFHLVMPNAFSVFAREVAIRGNYFNYLQTEALQQITPQLWDENSIRSISYSFQNNHVQVADFGSLHVNLVEYVNARATMKLGNNTFSCSCTHLGWLGIEFIELSDFHNRILSPDENNTCIDAPCYLPLSILEILVQSKNICATNLTTTELCNIYNHYVVSTSNRNIASSHNNSITTFLLICFLVLQII